MRKAFINWCSRRRGARRERRVTDKVAEAYSKSRAWKKQNAFPDRRALPRLYIRALEEARTSTVS